MAWAQRQGASSPLLFSLTGLDGSLGAAEPLSPAQASLQHSHGADWELAPVNSSCISPSQPERATHYFPAGKQRCREPQPHTLQLYQGFINKELTKATAPSTLRPREATELEKGKCGRQGLGRQATSLSQPTMRGWKCISIVPCRDLSRARFGSTFSVVK